jgi:hypothetical protein
MPKKVTAHPHAATIEKLREKIKEVRSKSKAVCDSAKEKAKIVSLHAKEKASMKCDTVKTKSSEKIEMLKTKISDMKVHTPAQKPKKATRKPKAQKYMFPFANAQLQ